MTFLGDFRFFPVNFRFFPVVFSLLLLYINNISLKSGNKRKSAISC